MPRRPNFLSAITGGNLPPLQAGAAASAKLGVEVLPAHEGGGVIGVPAPGGFSIPSANVDVPGPNATPEQIAAWKARWGIETAQVSVGASGESARLNVITLMAQEWKPIMVDRPTILKSAATDLTGLVYYAPDTKLESGLLAHAQRSHGAGIVYLPQRGTWFVFYNGTAGTQTDWTQIDATDPLVAARYTGEQGAQFWVAGAVTAPITATPSIQLVDANRDRRGLIIQNQGTIPVLCRFVPGTAVPSLSITAGSSSWQILQNSEMFLTGDQGARQRVVVQSTTGSTCIVQALQMF